MLQAIGVALLLMTSAFAQSPVSPTSEKPLPWIRGPAVGELGTHASIKIDERHAFLGDAGTRQLLLMMGNPPRDKHYSVVSVDSDWVAIFAFDDIGYVKDDEKIDPDALMEAMKEGNERNAAERKKLGLTDLRLVGWHVPPHYDSATKRLEWGTKLLDGDGNTVVNYTARLLGRNGVMAAILVTDPKSLDADRVAFNRVLEQLEFKSGERYAEFRQGDKIAAYGLAALVAGGAAAAAAKSAGGKALFKGIGLAILAGAGALWAWFRNRVGKTGASSDDTSK